LGEMGWKGVGLGDIMQYLAYRPVYKMVLGEFLTILLSVGT